MGHYWTSSIIEIVTFFLTRTSNGQLDNKNQGQRSSGIFFKKEGGSNHLLGATCIENLLKKKRGGGGHLLRATCIENKQNLLKKKGGGGGGGGVWTSLLDLPLKIE